MLLIRLVVRVVIFVCFLLVWVMLIGLAGVCCCLRLGRLRMCLCRGFDGSPENVCFVCLLSCELFVRLDLSLLTNFP